MSLLTMCTILAMVQLHKKDRGLVCPYYPGVALLDHAPPYHGTAAQEGPRPAMGGRRGAEGPLGKYIDIVSSAT